MRVKQNEMIEERHDELADLLTNEDFKMWILKPTYERKIFWEKWLENNPEKREVFNTAAEIIRSTKFRKLQLPVEDKDQILSNIISNTPIEKPVRSLDGFGETQNNTIAVTSFIYKAAAVLIFVALFTGLIYWNLKNDNIIVVSSQPTTVHKENPKGRKSVILLPDGTKVTLNSMSKLSYDSEYGLNNRTVRVEGEAFFEVQKDALKPFRVVANDVITTALGTSFNVRAFRSENTQTISLRTGSVKISTVFEGNLQQEYFLEPGEGYVIDNHNRAIKKIDIDPQKIFSWKDGVLVFKDDRLENVIETLERWYDVEFTVVGQPVKAWRADGRYDNESLENVLQGLSYTYDLEFLIKGKDVELKFN